MRIIRKTEEMVNSCKQLPRPVGLVPTMGALHEGHLTLVRQAIQDNATVVVTIFVNPSQFGPHEDYETYPNDLATDTKLLAKESVQLLFAPLVSEMYRSGYDTWVHPGNLASRLEGTFRPNHFRGVATVVTKLINIVRPDRAYFGQKDGQQATIIKHVVDELNLDTHVVILPTVREFDGLALSSRNAYLTSKERQAAPVIYRALCLARDSWRDGQRKAELLRKVVTEVLTKEPLILSIDYVSIADTETLEELSAVDMKAMISVAVWIGKARLIDNILLE